MRQPKTKTNYFPKISTYLNLNNANSYENTPSLFSSTRKPLKQISESASTTDFFARNYDNYLEKVKQRNKVYNSTLKSEFELNSLLYKLKNYYSDVVSINTKKKQTIIYLRKTLGFEEFKLNQVIELQDIELPDEKISVKNFNELKLTKNEVEKQLRNLMKEKQHLDELIKNESEYFKTIEYMCEEEKNRFKEIKKETNIIAERINNVKQYQRIIDYNLGKEKIKISEEKILEDKLGKGMELIEQVNLAQKEKNERLNKIIYEKERQVEELKARLLAIKRQNKIENLEYQNEIKKKIETAKEFGENQRLKEKKVAEIIYCLYLIQNYFINEENFDREKMKKSAEYKLLEKKNFDILYNGNNNTLERNYNKNKISLSPAFSENMSEIKLKLENDKVNLDDKKEEKDSNKEEKENENESEISESKNSGEDKKEANKNKEEEDKKEKVVNPSIFLTNLGKKLSVINVPLENLNLNGENNEKKEKNVEIKRAYTTKNMEYNIYNFVNKVESKNLENNKNDNNIKIEDGNIDESEKKQSEKNENIEINISNQNNNNNNNNNNNKEEITNNFNNRKSNDYAVLTFEDLKEKSALIKLNRKSLFNYNAKLTSKLNFYKIQFDLFHKKELELEDLRSILNQRASKIIQENFLSFKQLVKINPGIKEFIKKNKDFIEQVKNQNKKEKLKEMNKKINETNPVNNQEKTEIINNETEDKNDEYELNLQFMNNMQVLIHSIQKLIMINKDFFMKCNEHFKLIKSTLELIADFEKKEFEKNDNNDKNNLNKVNFKDKGETNDNIQIFQDVIKIISDEDSELDILINKMNQKNLNDKNNLLNYIKNLINFVQTDDELKSIFDIDKLNTDLLYNFYKDVDTQRIKTSFYKQFKLKRFPILDSEFNHFTTISNDLTAQIKKISKIVSDLEQNEKLNKLFYQKSSKIKRKMKEGTRKNSISLTNKNIYLGKRTNIRYDPKIRVFNRFKTISLSTQKDTSYSELEFMSKGKVDEDDIPDNYTKKKVKKALEKKINSQEKNIVDKLYSPFLLKTSYLRKLNQNLKGIKSMTTLNCKTNHTLRKRKGEVDNLTHQMFIYSNPLINPNKLANQTYNSLAEIAIRNQNQYKYDKNYLNPNLIYN